MDTAAKRAAREEWLDRPQDAGIYALRFRRSVWVGAAPRLAAAENRLRFALSQGLERNAGLAAAWAEDGPFAFQVLEALDPKLSAMARQRLLKERAEHWRHQLGAWAI